MAFEKVVDDLKSADRVVRSRAVQLLNEAAYPEAAVPLAAAITDPDDDVQLGAIAAELNLFLTEKVATRKRVGLLIEVKSRVAAAQAFSHGPLAVGPRPIPDEVLNALRTAARDANPRIAVEALYAFGTLAVEPSGARRRAVLHAVVPDLASMTGAANADFRLAAARVIGRVYEQRAEDDPVDPVIADAMIAALNDGDRRVRAAAMDALGAMKYERAVAALTEQFQFFGRGELAGAALGALARIAHPSSAPSFVAQLGSNRDELKRFAIEGLARIGDRSRLEKIEAALNGESDDRVFLAASFAAVKLGGRPFDPLAEALRKPALADQARQYLIEVARERPTAFVRHAQDPDVQIRVGVADILGMAGDPAALSIVEPMRRDRDPQVATAAERAIARLTALRRTT